MTILITGDSSPLGRRLLQRLSKSSTLVVGTSRRSATHPLDLADEIGVTRLLERIRPTAIVHLAGLSGVYASDLATAREANVRGTESIIYAARRTGVERVIFASTSAVYGTRYCSPITESADLDLSSAYARSKREAELTLLNAAKASDFEVVVLRIFNMWGEGYSNSLVARLANASGEAPVELSGLDGFVRDYVHVDDVVASFESALSGIVAPTGVIINIGMGIATSNRDLVESLAVAPTALKLLPEVVSYSCANIDVARETLGFHPTRRPVRLTRHE